MLGRKRVRLSYDFMKRQTHVRAYADRFFFLLLHARGFRVLAVREIYLKKICTSDSRDICVAAKPLRPKLRGLVHNPTTEILYIDSLR